MNRIQKIALSLMLAVGASTALATSSQAAGAFDFLDPCYEARDNFANARSAAYAALDSAEANLESATAPTAYREAWIAEKKEALRAPFNDEFGTFLWNNGVSDEVIDALYNQWFERQLGSLTPEQLAQLQDSHFRTAAQAVLLERRQATEGQIAEGHRRISEACQMDVFNQALRVVLTPIMNNWNAAADEGFIAQAVSVLTGGVNIVDLVRCPIRGCSDASVVNQLLGGAEQVLVDVGAGIEHLGGEIGAGIVHLGGEIGAGVDHLGGEIAKVFGW